MEVRVEHGTIIEIGPQGEHYQQRPSRFAGGRQQQLDETPSLVFGVGLAKEFLELVYQQHDVFPRLFDQLTREYMQPPGGIILQIFANGDKTPVGKSLSQDEAKRLDGVDGVLT